VCFVVLSVVVIEILGALVGLVLVTRDDGVVIRKSGNGVNGSKANKEEHFSADVEQFPPVK